MNTGQKAACMSEVKKADQRCASARSRRLSPPVSPASGCLCARYSRIAPAWVSSQPSSSRSVGTAPAGFTASSSVLPIWTFTAS